MLHTLVHIYGPFSIHSFGLMLAFGLAITVFLATRNPLRARIMSSDRFIDAISLTIITGLVGSRLLFVVQNWASLEHWTDIFSVWTGGFSVLGSVIGVLTLMPIYLAWHQIPFFLFFDLIAIYAPLLQSIARLGCFFAGCCFGSQTTVPWGIIYTDPESFAPLCTQLHPAQLYSSALLFGIFLILIYGAQNYFKKPGYCLAIYLFLISVERFYIDFFRGDHEFFDNEALKFLSVHQWISIGIAITASLLAVYIYFDHSKELETE